MEMRSARLIGMCGLMIVGLACGKVSRDSSKVLANVGGEKITEKSFGETVTVLVGDEARAKDLLTNPANKEQRNRFLSEIADQKAVIKYGEKQGLDKDPKVKALVEAAKANAYGQFLLEKAVSKIEPTEAQLKALYDREAARAKAEGREKDFPPFEAVKPQVANAWKGEQLKEATKNLLNSVKAQFPVTIDPMWRSEAK